jgi:uncharacterized protein (DUF927 family)
MRREVVDSIYEIVNEIPKINKAHYIFLHRQKHYTNTRCHFIGELDAYGTSTDMVNFKEGSLEEIRDKKYISYLITHELLS